MQQIVSFKFYGVVVHFVLSLNNLGNICFNYQEGKSTVVDKRKKEKKRKREMGKNFF